jgi:hypothetical protein
MAQTGTAGGTTTSTHDNFFEDFFEEDYEADTRDELEDSVLGMCAGCKPHTLPTSQKRLHGLFFAYLGGLPMPGTPYHSVHRWSPLPTLPPPYSARGACMACMCGVCACVVVQVVVVVCGGGVVVVVYGVGCGAW